MKTELTWTGSMNFEATADGHTVSMDAKSPIGHNSAMTPKELVATGLGGCTAMDVAALFKKHKQTPEKFNVTVDVETSTGIQPAIFTKAHITFSATGPVSKDVFLEAVVASQTKYCGVSAMLSLAFPIYYEVILNNEKIGEGRAEFSADLFKEKK